MVVSVDTKNCNGMLENVYILEAFLESVADVFSMRGGNSAVDLSSHCPPVAPLRTSATAVAARSPNAQTTTTRTKTK